MKKIAFVMPWGLPMPPVHGGAVETLVQGLIDENERSRRLQITVFTKDDPQARALYGQYRHTEFVPICVSRFEEKLAWFYRGVMNKLFHRPHTPGLAYLLKLCLAMRGRKFDRVIVENQAPFVPLLHRMQVGAIDLHMHNIVILSEMRKPRRVAEMCSRVITVSDYISRWMCENIGHASEDCRVLLNCVDVNAFRAARSRRNEMRAKLNLADDEIMLLFTGRLCPEKGALELARAFVQADIPRAKLVFVGSQWFGGNEASPYQSQIQKELENVKDRVLFTGYVPHCDIPDYYAAADIAVLPSVWDEPGALTVLEAQAAGVPVVSTLSGGIPSNTCPEGAILLERGDGLVNCLAATLADLAADPEKRGRMSEAALAWSSDRCMANYYDGFVALMEK